MMRLAACFLTVACLVVAGGAWAKEVLPQDIAFAGGKFSIAAAKDNDSNIVLAFDGREIARNHVVRLDRTLMVAGREVALFLVGDGGDGCGPATMIAWRPDGETLKTEIGGKECGASPAAVSDDAIYFVPNLIPGASGKVESWSPHEGMRLAGLVSFAPESHTEWDDLDLGTLNSIVDAMHNEAVYTVANRLLGDNLRHLMASLQATGRPAATESGVLYSSGCAPHACGNADAFMAIDAKAQKLYFAQERDQSEPAAWPALDTWPVDVSKVMREAFKSNESR